MPFQRTGGSCAGGYSVITSNIIDPQNFRYRVNIAEPFRSLDQIAETAGEADQLFIRRLSMSAKHQHLMPLQRLADRRLISAGQFGFGIPALHNGAKRRIQRVHFKGHGSSSRMEG